jgi:hypothetical protein
MSSTTRGGASAHLDPARLSPHVNVPQFIQKRRDGKIDVPEAEWMELAERAAAGDRDARDQLIDKFIPLMFILAKRQIKGRWELLDDLNAAALLGLVEAASEYSPSKGTKEPRQNNLPIFCVYWAGWSNSNHHGMSPVSYSPRPVPRRSL